MFEILLALLLWGGAVEPRLILDTTEEVAKLPALPAVWEGERIALIADWQIGMWLDNPEMVERTVETLIREQPAAVLFAGDFIYKPGHDPRDEVGKVLELLRPLTEAEIPAFAVLGNHDLGLYEKDDTIHHEAANILVEGLEELGVRVLRNEAAPLVHPDRRPADSAGRRSGNAASAERPALATRPTLLYIVGIGPLYADRDDPIAALSNVPFDAPRVVLMHHPRSFRKIPAWNAPLALAGHRHGGQFRIPLVNWSWLRLVDMQAAGWADADFGQFGNRLYVSRGIGMSLVPIRISCPPEITFFTLERPRRE